MAAHIFNVPSLSAVAYSSGLRRTNTFNFAVPSSLNQVSGAFVSSFAGVNVSVKPWRSLERVVPPRCQSPVMTVLLSLPNSKPVEGSDEKLVRWPARVTRAFAMGELEARKLKHLNTGTESILMGILVEDSLPYAESSILGCAVFTAYGAMVHAAEVRGGDSVAVIGIGGVGSSCLQIAKAFGASAVIAVDISEEKLQKAKAVGATHTVNALQEDAVEKIKEITGGTGVDIAIEALGKPRTFLQCTQSVRDGGKAVMIGLADASARGKVDINRLVRRQVKIIGSYGARARQDLPKIIKLAESGTFDLSAAISRKYKFEDAEKAYQDLNLGKIIGRAVVDIA